MTCIKTSSRSSASITSPLASKSDTAPANQSRLSFDVGPPQWFWIARVRAGQKCSCNEIRRSILAVAGEMEEEEAMIGPRDDAFEVLVLDIETTIRIFQFVRHGFLLVGLTCHFNIEFGPSSAYKWRGVR